MTLLLVLACLVLLACLAMLLSTLRLYLHLNPTLSSPSVSSRQCWQPPTHVINLLKPGIAFAARNVFRGRICNPWCSQICKPIGETANLSNSLALAQPLCEHCTVTPNHIATARPQQNPRATLKEQSNRPPFAGQPNEVSKFAMTGPLNHTRDRSQNRVVPVIDL